MKLFKFFISGILLLQLAHGQQAKENLFKKRQKLNESQVEKAKKAQKIIDAWRGENPKIGKRTLKIIYWSPSDRAPQPNHKERLSDILLDIQRFYAKEMERNGFGRLTMKLNKDKNGGVEIIDIKGVHPYKHYKTDSGNEIKKECEPHLQKLGIDVRKETIVIFCNMANWNPVKKRITQNSPYYAFGNSNYGTAWQVDSAILKLDDLTNVKVSDRVRDGQYGLITRGKYNTIFIGGIAHELGHTFGLPHNLENVEERIFGIALMGAGNRAYGNDLRKDGRPAFLTFSHALKLASHPMFSGVTKKMWQEATFNYENLAYRIEKDKVIIRAKISSNIPSYSHLAYIDPNGKSDYDAMVHAAITQADGTFSISIPLSSFRKPGTKGRINLVSVFANGKASSNQTPARKGTFQYFVDPKKGLQIFR